MMKRMDAPLAVPTIPECKFVYHVIHWKGHWVVRAVRYQSYKTRLAYYGDDGLYFASEVVANDVRAVKEKYEKDVAIHAPKGA